MSDQALDLLLILDRFGEVRPTELEKNGRILRTIHEPPTFSDMSPTMRQSLAFKKWCEVHKVTSP